MSNSQDNTSTSANVEGIADRIRAARANKNLNQVELCKLSTISLSTLKKIEGGTTPKPQTRTLGLLAKALDVDAGFLRTGNRPPDPIASEV